MTQFEQPTRSVGGGGSKGRLAVVGWVVAFVAIVGFALSGAERDGADAPRAVAATPGPTSPAASDPPAPVLTLTDPAPNHSAIETVALWIRGQAADAVHDVELVLVRDDSATLRQTVPTSSRGTFSGVFTLGPPRAAGTVVVVAIGRDEEGSAVERVERDVRVAPLRGALAPGAPAAAAPGRVPASPGRPPRLGEDGVLGARGVDLTEYPRSGGRRPARNGADGPVGTLAKPALL